MSIIDNIDKPFRWIISFVTEYWVQILITLAIMFVLSRIHHFVTWIRYMLFSDRKGYRYTISRRINAMSYTLKQAIGRLNDTIEIMNKDSYVYHGVMEEFDFDSFYSDIAYATETINGIVESINSKKRVTKTDVEWVEKTLDDLYPKIEVSSVIWTRVKELKAESAEKAKEFGYEKEYDNRYSRYEANANAPLTFFAGCKTKTDVKRAYRILVKKHHPDQGGDTETFTALQSEYERVIKQFS